MRWARWSPVTVAVAGVLVFALGATAFWADRRAPRLSGHSTLGFCAVPADWDQGLRSGWGFGLDDMRLTPAGGRLTVTGAELVEPRGGIRLLKTVFAPQANFGSGLAGEPWGLPPYLLPYLRTTPADLTPLARPLPGADDTFNSVFDGDTWQAAAVVTVSPTATDASAAGLTLHYRSGSQTRSYTILDKIRILHGPQAGCGDTT